jgi:hypothetical protein
MINDKRKIDNILKKIDNKVISSMYKYQFGECKNNGFIFTRFCTGYILEKFEDHIKTHELYLLMTKKTFESLIDIEDNDPEIEKDINILGKEIEIYDREGNYYGIYYSPRKIIIENNPTPVQKINQENIISKIIEYYKENKKCTTFINGLPGSGKTNIAFLLAAELNGTLCKKFNPVEPGDTLCGLIDRVKPTFKRPLIILLDEINIMIRKIHTQSVPLHKNIPVLVFDKTSFNSFLDDMKYESNIILLLTSNESRKQMDLLDPSYIREGRINKYFEMIT